MFLHQSNRLESLLRQLHALVREPLADPLAPEIVVVQNPGMAQWVAQQLAFSVGIAAHLAFPLPARFVWDVLQGLAGSPAEEDRYRKPVIRWRIMALLPRLLGQPGFAEIAAYLREDDNGGKLYQLAGRISDVFDQYLVYRPDLLTRWEQGEETHWQAQLWRALVARAVPHRARLADRFRRLLAEQPDIPGRLPQRCHLFGLNSLAPVYLDVVAQLSRHIEVHLYHLSPCRHYWGDLVSARQMAGMRAGKRPPPATAIDAYYEEGHPLLLSLGKTGQDFFRQLLDYDLQEFDLYCENERPSLLATLQNDLLDLRDRTASPAERWPLQPDDRSVQCHCCFSPLREVQVLHDRLLDLFQRLPNLNPGDILASAPDIQIYADAIAGVFGEPGQTRRIPWSIADQTLNREHPLVRCFLDLLDLATGRFTAPEVLALLETPALLVRFGLDPALLPRLHAWVQETGIRWALDEAHRRELDLQTGSLHSWRFGLDRLLLGYLMGDSRDISCGILPYANLAAGEAAELGGFLDLIDTLTRWRLRLRQPRPVEAWCAELHSLLTEFFAPEEDEQGMRTLRDAINALKAECSLAGHEAPLAFAVLREHLKTTLAQPGGGQAFLSGRVTFCNMVPMRSVPFRVVCLLGMNDQDFPRAQHPVAFDLMASEPRLGDRNRRQDDRYLFLEAILSARDVLYLSWVGRNQRDDALAPPSAVIGELLDYLEQSCLFDETGIAARLTTVHPMQPFSRRCYEGSPATASFNPAWLPAEREGDPPPFLPAPLEQPADETWRTVDLRQLMRFWRHPVRYFLERILGLHVRDGEIVVAESEPFALDRLQHYQLRRETVADLLAGMPEERIRCDLEAGGQLPQGGFAQVEFSAIAQISTDFARHLRTLQTHPLEPVEIDRPLGPFRITGWLTDLYPEGRVTWRAGALKGADLIELWTHHLVLNLLAPPGMAPQSIHLSYDTTQKNNPVRRTTFGPLAGAAVHLRQLLDLYWQGLTRPLPFFPETSLAWAKAAGTGQEEERARPVWTGGYQRRGEGEDPAYSFFFPATTLPLTPEFIALAALFAPILSHLEARDRATA